MGPSFYRRARLLALALICSGFLVARIHRAQLGGSPAPVVRTGQPALQVTIPLELTQSASSKKPNPSYLFQLYDPKLPTKFKFTDPDPFSYFGSVGNATCFSLGTDFNASRTSCVCRPGWFSDDCSLPEAISSSKRFRRRWTNKKIHRRAGPPRRLVNAINVNHELDLLEVRLRELYDVVDVFVICESNYSARGEPKPLHLLPKLREGFLAPYQNKIVHVFLDHFPKKGREDGWFADGYQRTFLWRQAKKQLSGLKDDDLLILTDADEIPRAGPLAYLKTHEGFSEPMFLRLRWTLYGFFWQHVQEHVQVLSVCSMRFLSRVLGNDASRLRREDIPANSEQLYGAELEDWTLGQNGDVNAGWHCSWCFDVEGLRVKLRSAQKDDGVRWGDFPEKTSTRFLSVLVRRGLWFDGKKVTKPSVLSRGGTVPACVMDDDKYRYLLSPENSTLSKGS
ncbi:beta-1,4-mannosyl-glycoprotein 4-beta-N-acetylglucosaminyltransferase-like [Haemaphysalis longicornis]